MPQHDKADGGKPPKAIHPTQQADLDRLTAIVDELGISYTLFSQGLTHAIGIVAKPKGDLSKAMAALLSGANEKDTCTTTGLYLCGGCLDSVAHALKDMLHHVELLQAEYDKAE